MPEDDRGLRGLHRSSTLVLSAAMAHHRDRSGRRDAGQRRRAARARVHLRRPVRARGRRPLLLHLADGRSARAFGPGSQALAAIVWTSLASAIYFSLGSVTEHAAGLTPLVFLGSGVFFVLTAMTYAEGASMHPERAGSTVFARYAFNELWSFVAGWAVLLDFLILIAVTAFAATNYAAAFWAPLGEGRAGDRARARDHRLRRVSQHPRAGRAGRAASG